MKLPPPSCMYIVKDSHNYVFMEKRQRCLLFYLESTARRSSISIISQETEKNIHRFQNVSFSLFKIAYIHMLNVCKVCWKFKSSWNIWRQVKQIWNMGLLKCLQASVRGRGVWFQRLNINYRVNFRHTQIFLRPPQVVEKKEVVEVSSVWSQKRTFALRKGDFLISCFCFSW